MVKKIIIILLFVFFCSQAIFAQYNEIKAINENIEKLQRRANMTIEKRLNKESSFKFTNINQGELVDTKEGVVFIIPNNDYKVRDYTYEENAEVNNIYPELQKHIKMKSLICYNYEYNNPNDEGNVIKITCTKAISKLLLSHLEEWEDNTKKVLSYTYAKKCESYINVHEGVDIATKDIGNKKNVFIESLSYTADVTDILNPLALHLAEKYNSNLKRSNLKRFQIGYVFRYKTSLFVIEGNCQLKNKTKLIKDIEYIIKSIE